MGRIICRDDVRPQARQVLEELRREGLRAVVLTGDRKGTAEPLRSLLKIQDIRSELKPEEKLAEIRAMPGIPPYLYLKHLEPVVQRIPDAEERVAAMRRYMRSRRESRAAAPK